MKSRVFQLQRITLHTALPVALLLFAATGCGKARHGRAQGEPALPTASVKTEKVVSRVTPAIEEVVGTVRAVQRASIEAKTTGRIAEMPVTLGQKVRAGDLLARLDAPEIKARLDAAQAGFQLAEREWKRISGLYEKQAATRADYESAESRLEAAKAGVAEATALLGYVEVRAPFDGVIANKRADAGDLAAPGKPLVDLEDPTRLQVEANVPEAIASAIKPGQPIAVRVTGRTEDLTGKVAELAPVADPVSRTVRIKLDLPTGTGLFSGQFARILVPVGEASSLYVPSSAVVERGQLEIVFVARDQHAQLHLVKTGRRAGGETEILSGLNPGDMVVIENASALVDGQPLELK